MGSVGYVGDKGIDIVVDIGGVDFVEDVGYVVGVGWSRDKCGFGDVGMGNV